MKGQACSWSDMRRIKRILDGKVKLPGASAALKRCVTGGAISNWRKAIEVMDAVQISEHKCKHVQQSHAEEIGRRVKDRDQWAEWVKRCEKNKWTVVQLREQLQGGATQRRIAASYDTAMNQFLAALQRAQQMPERLYSTAKVINGRHKEILKQIEVLEQLLARANAA